MATNSVSIIAHYDNKTFVCIADTVGMILSCLIPILSMIVLYLVRGIPVRLGIIATFMVLFSWILLFGQRQLVAVVTKDPSPSTQIPYIWVVKIYQLEAHRCQ
jgi:hypothetical protein